MITEETILHNLPINQYHADPAISKTTLHRWHQSPTPAHFKAFKEPKKDHLEFGKILHMAVLEPHLYEKTVVVPPQEVLNKGGGRSGTAWYAWEEEQLKAGKSILLPHEKMALDYALEEIFQNPQNREAAELLDPAGVSEVSFFWQDFETNHFLKCRIDKLPGNGIIVDLKTAKSAEPNEFGKQAANLKYLWSAALSLKGVTECTKLIHSDYRYIVIEKTEPYGVAVYRAMTEDIEFAKYEIRQNLNDLVACLKNNEFPCYPDGTSDLIMPYWSKKPRSNSLGVIYD